jgi:uncharacterized protein (DUF1778 family)
MKTKDATIYLRLDVEMRQALEAAAEAQERSLAAVVRDILDRWLRRQQKGRAA